MFFLLQSPVPISIPGQPTDYTQWGIAGAVVLVVVLFLWFLTKEREDRKAERDSFVKTIRERDQEYTEIIRQSGKEVADAMEKFGDLIRGCHLRNGSRKE